MEKNYQLFSASAAVNVPQQNTTSPSPGIDSIKVYTKYNIGKNLTLYEFDFTNTTEKTYQLDKAEEPSFYFIYNLTGSLTTSYIGKTKETPINQFQSAMVFDKENEGVCFHFEEDEDYKFCVVQLEKDSVAGSIDSLYLRFENMLSTINKVSPFIYTGVPNLNTCEQINKLLRLDKNTLHNKLIATGYINIVLGLKVCEFLDYINGKDKYTGTLNSREMKQIELVSLQIQKNPEVQYTIDSLCKETGLSVPKLQEGFKEMHDTTVADYIRRVRLETAENLMKTTDLNISEIVYTIGLTSRSYFSRIFKRKYKCTPRSYQKQLSTLAATA